MSASFESKKNTQATMITAGFTALAILLMFLISWRIPEIVAPIADAGIEVDLQLPPEEDIPVSRNSGGGGGGNPVQAAGPAGAAPYTPPSPGEEEDSRDVETDDNNKAAPEITKPVNPKPAATKIVENTNPVKTTPKPEIENPQPVLRKGAQMGKTTSGTGRGGGAADY